MKHIVQVLTDSNVGGAGKYLLNYLKAFDRTNFKVTVIVPENSQLCEFIQKFEDVTLLEAPFISDCSFHKNAIKHLKKIFLEIKPDMLHTHACLSARIAGRQAKVPLIFATRHCIEPVPRGPEAIIKTALNNKLCDYYIAVSDAVINNLVESGVRLDKIRLVNNGVDAVRKLPDAAAAMVRTRYNIRDDEIIFSIIARLEPVKGHKYFIKAARQIIRDGLNAKFLIVGSGSLEEELKALVAHYHLENYVIFTGFLNDTTEILNASDVNVIASESEAMCLSILEAMSIGKPSIATAVGGNTELIDDSKDGLLVGYADSSSLAEAMTKLIKDPAYIAELGKNAKEKYESGYTVEIMVNRLEDVYKEVAKA